MRGAGRDAPIRVLYSLRSELDAAQEPITELPCCLAACLFHGAGSRADVGEVRRDLHVLSDRVARIEGALAGPWRPPAKGRHIDPRAAADLRGAFLQGADLSAANLRTAKLTGANMSGLT